MEQLGYRYSPTSISSTIVQLVLLIEVIGADAVDIRESVR